MKPLVLRDLQVVLNYKPEFTATRLQEGPLREGLVDVPHADFREEVSSLRAPLMSPSVCSTAKVEVLNAAEEMPCSVSGKDVPSV